MTRGRSSSGDSLETAITIPAENHVEGVSQEYRCLSRLFVRRGVDWDGISQTLIEQDGRCFDHFEIQVGDQALDVYFDISSFFPPGSSQS